MARQMLNEAWKSQEILLELNDVIKWVEKAPTLGEFLQRIDGYSLDKLLEITKSISFQRTQDDWDDKKATQEEKILEDFLSNIAYLARAQSLRTNPEYSEISKLYNELDADQVNKERLEKFRSAMRARREHNDPERFAQEKREIDNWYANHPAIKDKKKLANKMNAIEDEVISTSQVNAEELLNPVGEFETKKVKQIQDLWKQMTGNDVEEPKDAEVLQVNSRHNR
jgi:hypothetical protein